MSRTNRLVIALAVVAAAAAAGWWWLNDGNGLPDYIGSGNGRIEAEQVTVATRVPGRVDDVLVEEGDSVAAGQVLALMDTAELDASLARAQADIAYQREVAAQAEAAIAQRESELHLAEQELERAVALLEKGFISRQAYDQREAAVETARAALRAAEAALASAERAVDAADAEAARIETQIDDAILTAPRDGRVQYRLAEPGEVLGAGGPVLTLLDLSNVTMTVFLPTDQVGRVAMGAEARIVLDAAPDYVIPATVSFIAAEAQFTPREVETRSEREKLMFRVKVRIAPDLLRAHADQVKTGLPGEAFIMLAPGGDWPEALAVRLPAAGS
ncbi:MAG: HlyD family efflux transporter periplasmic adaptor subunit [Alphaproteobacteria bacterium]